MKKTLFIIDGSSCIYRAYHAIPRFTTSKGLPTNAVYGFIQTLKKIIKAYSPDYLAVAFDVKGPSFRHGLFEEYKVERPPMPDDLSVQIPYIKKVTRALNVPAFEKEGYEADDVIATLVERFGGQRLKGEGLKIVIVTGDKDMLQLVRGSEVVVLDYAKDKEIGEDGVKEKFAVSPAHITDLLGLAGDASDSIPGVRGIGAKTAAGLIARFGRIEGIYDAIGRVTPDKLRGLLEAQRDAAFLSKELATLRSDVPLYPDDRAFSDDMLRGLAMREPDFDSLEEILKELEFTKLIKELIPPKGVGAEVTVVRTIEALRDLMRGLTPGGVVAMVLEKKAGDTASPAITGITVCVNADSPFYIPVAACQGGAVARDVVLDIIKGPVEDREVKKVTDDAKSLFMYFRGEGIRPAGVEMDVTIASYLLNPTRSPHGVPDVAYHYLGERIAGEGGGEPSFTAGARAAAVLRLFPVLGKKLGEEGLERLFSDMEMPMAGVLADMELKGIRLDRGRLERLSVEMEREIKRLEEEIYSSAGYRFNINSPKQLSELLFERLGLKPARRIKTGYSTDEAVLSALAGEHAVARAIINFRQLAKLKGTYVDSLLTLVNPKTGRVHTSFNQTVTATGRLSSSRPNLQNIPVRGEYADRIREAFVADEGCLFLAADYSQIELRLVAHLSEDPALVEAFRRGADIHSETAASVFGVMPALVTAEMRRRAKAINFGIIYGMGPQGLASELAITLKDARLYIAAYFEHYKKVREFIVTTIEEAKERGYTETLFGRRRYIPELSSSRVSDVRLGERMAVNTPVQGSAADIIKKAMINIHKRLASAGLASKMILQIHDELIIEAPEGEITTVKDMVKEEMEGVISLDVPLTVNIGVGVNWNEAG